MTASAPRPSKRATAWRAAVVSMSPRLASTITRIAGRRRRKDPLEGRHARAAEGLEEREVGLEGRRMGCRGLDQEPREALHPGEARAEPSGSISAVGSMPTQRTVPVAAPARRPGGRGTARSRGGGSAGSPRRRWARAPGRGPHHAGRLSPSSPLNSVSGFLLDREGRRPSRSERRRRCRSTVAPTRRRNRRPACRPGDHAAPQDRPSEVTRRSSSPVRASRMTTLVPIEFVLRGHDTAPVRANRTGCV